MIARRLLQDGINKIESSICDQSDRVEQMIRTAYRGMSERCLGTADEVKAMEQLINEYEVTIETECLTLIALHQPVASDLRRIAAALKINADLERIADLALNLAERTESLADYPEITVPSELADMVLFAIKMLHRAKQAFLENDAEMAVEVCEMDSELDEMNRHLISELVKEMDAGEVHASGLLHVFSASRIVERMGDHATNIAEDVEFIVNGEIRRHRFGRVNESV